MPHGPGSSPTKWKFEKNRNFAFFPTKEIDLHQLIMHMQKKLLEKKVCNKEKRFLKFWKWKFSHWARLEPTKFCIQVCALTRTVKVTPCIEVKDLVFQKSLRLDSFINRAKFDN